MKEVKLKLIDKFNTLEQNYEDAHTREEWMEAHAELQFYLDEELRRYPTFVCDYHLLVIEDKVGLMIGDLEACLNDKFYMRPQPTRKFRSMGEWAMDLDDEY